jgi:hypothetical protein
MKIPGFHFTETMQGTYTRDGVERPIKFSLEARAESALQHLRDRKARIHGTIDAEGLAIGRELDGELIIDPLIKRIIRYEFMFTGDDGQRYRFAGQKDVNFMDLSNSMTTLPAQIFDGWDQQIATALVKFDKKDLPRFLGSWRLSF